MNNLLELSNNTNKNFNNKNENKKQNNEIISSNYSPLNNTVKDLNHSINNNSNNNGCGRFPTNDSATSKINYNENRLKYNQFGNGQDYLHLKLMQSEQRSPSPDTLSDISQQSVSFLPQPRPKHNIREQLLNAGMSTPNVFLTESKQSNLSFCSNFPSPTSNSVAMRISALEKKPGTPKILNLAGVINGSQQKQSTTTPMSPRSTVFRTKPIIQVDMGTTTITATTTKALETTKNLFDFKQQKQIYEQKVGKFFIFFNLFAFFK